MKRELRERGLRSRQVRLFLTRDDWRRLLERLQRTGDPGSPCEWLLLHDSSLSRKPFVLRTLNQPAGLPRSIHRYLVLRSDLDAVTSRYLQKPGHWDIDDLRSPVIQLSLGAVNGAQLLAGRMYCTFGYHGEDGGWIAKGEEFKRCALLLFRRARSFLDAAPSPHQGLIGPEASARVSKGDVELRDVVVAGATGKDEVPR